MVKARWWLLLAIASIGMALGAARGQTAETLGMITEIKNSRGAVEVKTAGADWRPATPLNALRAGGQLRASADASAFVMLSGGRGTIRIAAANSPYTVAAGPADPSKAHKAQTLLTASLGFLAGGPKEPPKAVLSTRSVSRLPEIVTPRNEPVLPDALVFEWLGTPFSRYTVRILDPGGVILEKKGVAGARLAYPSDAPALRSGVRYRLQVEAPGHPPFETWFEVVDAERAAAVRDDLKQLETALGPGVPPGSLAVVKGGALASQGLFHDARLVVLAALVRDPDEPALHTLLGNLYLKTNLPELAAESLDEAEALLSRDAK